MQNPAVANTLPAVQAPVSSAQNSVANQPAETFGSVLARQQTSAEEPVDNGQATPTRAARATGDSEITGSIPKDAQGVTDEMLAALLPDADSILRAAGAADNTPLAAGAGDTQPADALTIQLPAQATTLPYTAPFAQTASCTTGDMPPTLLLLRVRDDGAAPPGERSAGALPAMTTQSAQETAGFDTLLPVQFSGSARTSAPPVQPDATAITFLNTSQQYSADPTAPVLVGAVQLRLNTPLANRSWGEDLGQKVVWMVAQGAQTAELHLNPPLLGPLDVVLNVSGDQATALFASPHATVRLAVEQALPKLREMLADNGITLGNATVGDQLPENRQGGPENGQQGKGFRPDSAGSALLTGASQNGVTVLPGRRHEGMVDIFA